jgi:hypothetical protein
MPNKFYTELMSHNAGEEFRASFNHAGKSLCQVPLINPKETSLAHTYNPNYSGGGDWEDHGLRLPRRGEREAVRRSHLNK